MQHTPIKLRGTGNASRAQIDSGSAATSGNASLPFGLRVERRLTVAGTVTFEATSDHRIRVHAGPPVRGACSHHHFVYTRGDVDIWPVGLSDTWREEQASESIVLRLPLAALEHAAEETGAHSERLGLSPRHQFRDPQIEHIAWAVDAERRAGYPSGRLYLDSLGLALAVHLLGSHSTLQRLPRRLSRRQQERLTTYIEAHLGEPLPLLRLADIAGISASHLKVLFKRSTGMPVHAYVMQRRVERAKSLLLSGEGPLSQVALEVGFAHQSHMARWMRRLLGATPSALARRGLP